MSAYKPAAILVYIISMGNHLTVMSFTDQLIQVYRGYKTCLLFVKKYRPFLNPGPTRNSKRLWIYTCDTMEVNVHASCYLEKHECDVFPSHHISANSE